MRANAAPPSTTARTITACAAAASLLLGACANPFAMHPEDYGDRAAVERLRVIEPLALEPAPVAAQGDAADLPAPARFEGLEQAPLSIEEARAMTLANNLDLRVSLYDPAISAQDVSEEEARYEAVLFANVTNTSTDSPTASTLVGSQADSLNFNGGVRIPIRTGGQIDVTFPATRTETNNAFSTLNPAVTTDLQISFSQPLLRDAGRRSATHAIRIAGLREDISSARTKLEIISRLADVDRAYWRLYAARELLIVRQQQYELAMNQLERARRRVEGGLDSEIETIRAEEGVAQRLEAIIVAENTLLDQQRELKRVINSPDMPLGGSVMLVPASEPDPVRFKLDPEALVSAAMTARMELLEFELQLAIDASTIDFNRNLALPQLDFTATYRANGLGGNFPDATDQLGEFDFEDWIFNLNAETPIGNDAAKSRTRQSLLQRMQRIASRESRRQTIEQDVLDAIDNIDAGWRRILAARQTSILAARTLAGEQRQFEVGDRTSTDVLDAATRLADAQRTEIDAVTDYQIDQVDLAVSTGTLLGASRVDWLPLGLDGLPIVERERDEDDEENDNAKKAPQQ